MPSYLEMKMRIEDQIRIEKYKQMRRLQYDRRVIILHLPRWLSRVLVFYFGNKGPKIWGEGA